MKILSKHTHLDSPGLLRHVAELQRDGQHAEPWRIVPERMETQPEEKFMLEPPSLRARLANPVFRQKIRDLPGLGAALAWLFALLKLPTMRRMYLEDRQRIQNMERELAALQQRVAAAETQDAHPAERFDANRLYAEFSRCFRGEDADVAGKQQPYVPMIEEVLAGRAAHAVVDIGCGRGVWLGLLAQRQIAGIGFDLNAEAVNAARAKGLDVRRENGIDWLARAPDASIDVITAFQVIEHLPPETLLAFVASAQRVLRPGGLLLCETPNPGNLRVGACNFYMDPTHQRPIPAPFAEFIARYSGFAETRILPMNPDPEAEWVAGENPLTERFNTLFYGARDYALLARK
ncbi:MAG: class I SAM-dependent methyltransferase [Zoogloeaceae bacterium]|jgi:SAM-dependent methyltransferase|nr:class I SAM-dependent methyltransferase [Zoogloeaceae bacterium]